MEGLTIAAPAGAAIVTPSMLAAIVVAGEAEIEGERLGAWDFFYVSPGAEHAPVRFPGGATLLTVTLR